MLKRWTSLRHSLEARHEAGLATVPKTDVSDQLVPQVRSAGSEVAVASPLEVGEGGVVVLAVLGVHDSKPESAIHPCRRRGVGSGEEVCRWLAGVGADRLELGGSRGRDPGDKAVQLPSLHKEVGHVTANQFKRG